MKQYEINKITLLINTMAEYIKEDAFEILEALKDRCIISKQDSGEIKVVLKKIV